MTLLSFYLWGSLISIAAFALWGVGRVYLHSYLIARYCHTTAEMEDAKRIVRNRYADQHNRGYNAGRLDTIRDLKEGAVVHGLRMNSDFDYDRGVEVVHLIEKSGEDVISREEHEHVVKLRCLKTKRDTMKAILDEIVARTGDHALLQEVSAPKKNKPENWDDYAPADDPLRYLYPVPHEGHRQRA